MVSLAIDILAVFVIVYAACYAVALGVLALAAIQGALCKVKR